MRAIISLVTLVVRDYDEAIDFYVNKLGFALLEDTAMGNDKRWVRVGPGGGTELLLARATNPEQESRVGNQAGGRVMMFLQVEDFRVTHEEWTRNGVRFLESPRHESYGTVVVFQDLYGNKFDLIGPAESPQP